MRTSAPPTYTPTCMAMESMINALLEVACCLRGFRNDCYFLATGVRYGISAYIYSDCLRGLFKVRLIVCMRHCLDGPHSRCIVAVAIF